MGSAPGRTGATLAACLVFAVMLEATSHGAPHTRISRARAHTLSDTSNDAQYSQPFFWTMQAPARCPRRTRQHTPHPLTPALTRSVAGGLDAPLLRGTCAIDDGAFAVRGVQASVGFEEAKYSGFPGSVVPRTDPIPAGSDHLRCDLTGGFYAHPYAFNFSDVQGACTAPAARLCAQPRSFLES